MRCRCVQTWLLLSDARKRARRGKRGFLPDWGAPDGGKGMGRWGDGAMGRCSSCAVCKPPRQSLGGDVVEQQCLRNVSAEPVGAAKDGQPWWVIRICLWFLPDAVG